MSALCRCIAHLASKKREDQATDFAIDFEVRSKYKDSKTAILNFSPWVTVNNSFKGNGFMGLCHQNVLLLCKAKILVQISFSIQAKRSRIANYSYPSVH